MSINGLTVNISANSSSLVNAAQNAARLASELQNVINKKAAAGMALGTAHAFGTVRMPKAISTINGAISHAFAGGTQDWTVGQDEEALVNELG